jgi:predicted transcriptional regulator
MSDLKALVADIVGSYLTHNKLPLDQIPELIGQTHAALASAADGKPAEVLADDKPKPTAAQIRKSITDDKISCLICGQGFQSLKRHLNSAHGMEPGEYRAALGLRPDYPTVAPAYALRRSEYAKSIGLGRGGARRKAAPAAPALSPPDTPKATKAAPKKPAKPKAPAATAADRPRIKPATARPAGAIDPAADTFE